MSTFWDKHRPKNMIRLKNIRTNPKSETSQFVTGIKWRKLSSEAEAIFSNFIEMRTKDRRGEDRQLIRQ